MMLNLLEVPRITKTDNSHFEYWNAALDFVVRPQHRSFIIDKQSLPDEGFQLEAFPNKENKNDYDILVVGGYKHCLKCLNSISKEMEMVGVPHTTEMLDCETPPKTLQR